MRFDLTTRIRSSLRWQTLSTLLTGFGNILLLLVLTRYLDKADFGLFALLALFVSFSSNVINLGISQSLFSKPHLSDRQLSSLFLVNICLGLVAYLLLFALSPLIAAFFQLDRLQPLLRILALSVIINTIGNIYLVLLQKNMRFRALALTEVAAFGFFLSFPY